MRRILCLVGLVAGLGLATPAIAHWRANEIAPPGIPWAACSAPYGCAHPLYTRRLIPAYSHPIRHRRLVIRHHRAHPILRPRHVVLRSRKVVHRHMRYAVRGAFQYIDDPQLAAAVAWSDIVNAEAFRR